LAQLTGKQSQSPQSILAEFYPRDSKNLSYFLPKINLYKGQPDVIRHILFKVNDYPMHTIHSYTL